MSQQISTELRIREMILRGVLRPGERVRELDLAERLGLSRTPIRQALPALAREGLLVSWGARGYAVPAFTLQEQLDALHTRAALEGLAARAVATGHRALETAERLKEVLAAGDALLRPRQLADEVERRYGDMNETFHDTIVTAAGKPLLVDLIARCNVVPFTAPKTIAFEALSEEESIDLLVYAHRQHHAIVDAIRDREGARAEMLFREHAMTQEKSMYLTPDAAGRILAR